jgi:iron complex outermembrane receptor protein
MAQVSFDIGGIVEDEEGNPLPVATVFLLPDSLVQLSKKDGSFEFKNIQAGRHQLRIDFPGYKTKNYALSLPDDARPQIRIQLVPLPRELKEVVIFDEHAKQEDFLATDHVDAQELTRNLQGTLVQGLARLPGVSAINTGVGISKPIIRGLSFNRVIVNDQGIKQEGQQWGADHGLEIDQFAVSRVEVVKGAASLQYGSDGLGGVINLMPAPAPAKDRISGSLLGIAKSNNDHIGGSAFLALNRNDWWLAARYSRQDFADYRVPADTAIYQGFVIPLFDNNLKNTAGDESNIQIQTGLQRGWGVTRLTVSRYQLRSGLFSGAIGAPLSYALQPDGNRRDQDLPLQEVDHYKVIFNQIVFFGKNYISLDLGYQKNLRREFSFPEFHNQPEIDISNTLGLELDLQTISGNIHYEQHLEKGWTNTYGASVQYQWNQQSGWEFLLPNFNTWRSGAFFITDWQPKQSRWRMSGGLRLDLATNQSEFFQRYVWDSNARIIDSLSVGATDELFFNWSGSIGARYTIREEVAWLKINLGKSFRVPYPSETSSNGVHHGTFGHEQGTPDLNSEHGYQLDIGLDLQLGKWQVHLSPYVNYFDNFIYLGPSGRLSTLPEAGQIFRYQQTDAIYTGFELDWETRLTPSLSLHQAVEYVWNINLGTNLSLPFTPQPSILTELKYSKQPASTRTNEYFASISHRYAFANGPNRIDRNERTTPAYHLFDAVVGIELEWVEISIQGKNLLNTAYLDHLSRYRLLNLPEQGRNIVVSVKIPFQTKLK